MQSSSIAAHKIASRGAARRFAGYKLTAWAVAAHVVAAVLTGGLSLLACYAWPQIRLWTQRRCPLGQANYVKAELINGQHIVVKVQRCTPPASLTHTAKRGTQPLLQRFFRLLLVTYVYDGKEETFVAVPDMPADLPSQLCTAVQHLHQITSGATWERFNTDWPSARRERAHTYGLNDMSIGRPSLPAMVAHSFTNPMYIIQYVELAFLMYELRFTYAGVLYLISFAANLGAVWSLFWKRMELYLAIRQCILVPIVQAGRVRAVFSRRLVPGDVIVVLQGRATCDMVLLRGSCLVEESMLSGEAAHVRKSSYVVSRHGYHPESHHANTIHSGTYVQQVWNEEDGEDEVLAMVARTGLRTTVGNLLRQVMSPVHATQPRKDTFVVDLLKFYFFAFLLQLCIFMLYVSKANKHPASLKDTARSIVTRVVDVFIAAAPTGAPTVIVAALTYCILHLKSEGLVILLPEKIKTIADVEVVCFDKTGTLTGSLPDLHGLIPVIDGQFTSLQKDAVWWPPRLRQAAAICNSLTFVRKNKVVGDTAELKLCKAVEANFVDRNEVSLPLHSKLRLVRMSHLHILRRFEFEPSLLRSGVVAREQGSKDGSALLFVRGGTTTIHRLLNQQRTPPDFSKVVDDYASKSFRLLAVAFGSLRDVAKLDLASMPLQALERHAGHMDLLGLVVMTNHLRTDSKDTISHLQDRGQLRTMMVTGDYHYTATSVARKVGMIPADGKVMIIQAESEFQSLHADSDQPQSQHEATPVTQSPSGGLLERGAGELLVGARDYSHVQSAREFQTMHVQSHHCATPLRKARSELELSTAGLQPVQQPMSHPLPASQHSTQDVISLMHGWSTRHQGGNGQRLAQGSASMQGHRLLETTRNCCPGLAQASTSSQSHGQGDAEAFGHHYTQGLPQEASAQWARPLSSSQLMRHAAHGHVVSFSSDEQAIWQQQLSEARRWQGPAALSLPADAHMEHAHYLPGPSQSPQSLAGHAQSPAGHPGSPAGHFQSQSGHPQQLCHGLRVILEGKQTAYHGEDALQALTCVAQGRAQCCVTGPAFAHMLAQADRTVLDMVLQNVVVFARMQSQQKGQVMELLGSRGLHLVLDGQQHHIQGLGKVAMYCGDGINDLAALAAADVGMAVGSSDASAAASVITQQNGIAGMCTVIREARAGQSIKLNAIKYMVVYQLMVSLCSNSAYFMGGSSFSFNQIRILDFMALSMGIVAAVRPASPLLQPIRPPRSLCTLRNYVLVCETMLIACIVVFGCTRLLESQFWYTGGTGQANYDPVTTTLWLVACCNIICPMFSFSVDCALFCSSDKRPDLVVTFVYVAVVATGCMLGPYIMFQGHGSYFNLPFTFRYQAFAINVAGAITYKVALSCTRLLLNRYQRRVAPRGS